MKQSLSCLAVYSAFSDDTALQFTLKCSLFLQNIHLLNLFLPGLGDLLNLLCGEAEPVLILLFVFFNGLCVEALPLSAFSVNACLAALDGDSDLPILSLPFPGELW